MVATGGAILVLLGLFPVIGSWLGTIMHSGISAAALVAVVLNVVFNEIRGRRPPSPPVVAAPDERGNPPAQYR